MSKYRRMAFFLNDNRAIGIEVLTVAVDQEGKLWADRQSTQFYSKLKVEEMTVKLILQDIALLRGIVLDGEAVPADVVYEDAKYFLEHYMDVLITQKRQHLETLT